MMDDNSMTQAMYGLASEAAVFAAKDNGMTDMPAFAGALFVRLVFQADDMPACVERANELVRLLEGGVLDAHGVVYFDGLPTPTKREWHDEGTACVLSLMALLRAQEKPEFDQSQQVGTLFLRMVQFSKTVDEARDAIKDLADALADCLEGQVLHKDFFPLVAMTAVVEDDDTIAYKGELPPEQQVRGVVIVDELGAVQPLGGDDLLDMLVGLLSDEDEERSA